MPDVINILFSQAVFDIAMLLEESTVLVDEKKRHQAAIVRVEELLTTALALEPIFKINASAAEWVLSRPLQEFIREKRTELDVKFMTYHIALLTRFFKEDGGLRIETAEGLATLVVRQRPEVTRFFNVSDDILDESFTTTSQDKSS